MNKPYLSIIIPTYNRINKLTECLQACVELDYPRDRFEVIVVDDGGDMILENILKPFKQQIDIKLISQNRAGPATARNTGAVKAAGDYLIFTDDDCKPCPDWLKTLSGHFSRHPDAGIGGIMINALEDNIYSTASQMLIDYLQSYFNKQPHTASFLTTSNLAVPKDAFQRAGCFNAAFPRAAGEDREFCARWLRQGRALVFLSNAKVLHSHHLTFRSFIRQHFNYGQGAYCYHQILKQETGQSIKAEPSLFYWDLMRYAWIQKEQRKKIIITILILLSQIANATGFIYARFAPLLNK
jgi:glycosyltransferase involved in cell wall biosynthesis